jgi:uncharacterized repeat protein (TIGR02543 family)
LPQTPVLTQFGASVTVAPNAATTLTGYTFSGWSTSDATVANGSFTMPADPVAFTGSWTANTHDIIFDKNGGNGTMNNLSINFDETKALIGNSFTRDGYTFTGWNTNKDAASADYADEADYALRTDANVTLYAIWTPQNYGISFNANGGTDGTDMNSVPIAYDATTTLPENTFAKTGYSFKGWATEAKGEVVYADKASYKHQTVSTQELYAQWEAKTYQLAFGKNTDDSVSGTLTAINVVYDAEVGELPAPTRKGYTFSGWAATDNAGTSDFTAASVCNWTETKTVYAVWTAKGGYTVSYNTAGGTPETLEAKTSVTWTTDNLLPGSALTKTGYTFAGWDVTVNGTKTGVDGADTYGSLAQSDSDPASITLTARWTANSVTVNYYRNYDDNDNTCTTITTAAYETALPAYATPQRTGWTFSGWTTERNENGTAYVPGTTIVNTLGPLDLYAHWTENPVIATYALTVTNGTGGGSFAAGTQVSITANAAPLGQVFDKWESDNGGTFGDVNNSATTFTMPDNAVIVTAAYKDAPAKDIISFTIADAVIIMSGTNITVTVPHGTDVTALTPTITVSDGASVDPASGESQDFTKPVIYTVTAEDKTTREYTITVTTAPVTDGWIYGDGAWKYLVNGEAQTGWLYDGGAWYYLNADGIMQTGWLYDQSDKAWYYLAGNGKMLTGWVKDNGSWYYLAGNGKMVAGKWHHDTDGNWYYLSGNGKMLTGKQTIGGKVYTFKSNGVWVS